VFIRGLVLLVSERSVTEQVDTYFSTSVFVLVEKNVSLCSSLWQPLSVIRSYTENGVVRISELIILSSENKLRKDDLMNELTSSKSRKELHFSKYK